MAEQTFRSPGFFEQEIDLAPKQAEPAGVPAGIIGTAERGPAFVPVKVGSFNDFTTRFGSLDPDRFGPYAVREWLKNRTSCTYLRVLGAGANETSTDIGNTTNKGIVKNAGFYVSASRGMGAAGDDGSGRLIGGVQFLAATHQPAANELAAYPQFTDNPSFSVDGGGNDFVNLVRGVIFTATGTKCELLSHDKFYAAALTQTPAFDFIRQNARPGAIAQSPLSDNKYFKIVISSSAGNTFANDENFAGIRIISASLDPKDGQYISKVLNTDPLKFQDEQHLLYLDYAVEHELCPVLYQTTDLQHTVGLLSGSELTSAASGDSDLSFDQLFGRYDTRYTTPKTTKFISQPFGKKEYDLFHFETISDGAYGNDKFKVSIANIRASTDPADRFGTFEVQIRSFNDKDSNLEILERYPECSLNPRSDRYVAKLIGDKKVRYDFDQEDVDERRLVISGKYPNLSSRVRIQMHRDVENGDIPHDALPFGFRGLPVIKTTDTLHDGQINRGALTFDGVRVGEDTPRRLTTITGSHGDKGTVPAVGVHLSLTSSIVPPLPYRFKVTRGEGNSTSSPRIVGDPGTNERVDARLYWGVNNVAIPTSDATSKPILNANDGTRQNPIIAAYTKFQGIQKLDALVTGSGADVFNANKFTLARVALGNVTANNELKEVFTHVTGSSREHMIEAAYIRNGTPDRNTYTVDDRTSAGSNRFTLASLIQTSSILFNRFTEFAKFTNIFHGGFDGVNILDKDAAFFRDRAFSVDTGGKSADGDPDVGLATLGSNSDNQMGEGRRSNANASYIRAVEIMTDPVASDINVLVTPGVRDPFVTDHALLRVQAYSMAIYLMDLIKYDEDKNRLYDDSSARVDVRETAEHFDGRALNNNYGATYFPDVNIEDPLNNTTVKVPASVAALGAMGFNDASANVWFAPAGFNRGSLSFVSNIESRLTSADRDTLYDARINPIAVFPNSGFVIFGQKTLQITKSALDRVNVRRLMLEVKRRVVRVADRILFEPNTPATRAMFTGAVIPELAAIQLQSGIEQFKVVMDDSNNTQEDVNNNRLNGRIVVVPTRAVEFISIDFIITNSGVDFE